MVHPPATVQPQNTAPDEAWGTGGPREMPLGHMWDLTLSNSSSYILFLGPLQLKNDNGRAYTSKHLKELCSLWNIDHVAKFPYNPQG